MKTPLIVSAVQQACNKSRQENFQLSIDYIQSAANNKADLVVLPELHLDPYFCQEENMSNFTLAETIPGPHSEKLSQLAKALNIVIVTTLFEKRAPGIYHNSAVVFDKDGSYAGQYRKMHIPDDPGFYEKFYFTPGDLGFTPINTSIGRLGILICWDQWFPEAARLMTLAGAEILIYPTAIGWDPNDTPAEQERQRDAWLTIQRSHAVANGLPVISCNRIGFEACNDSGIMFWGNSFIAGPQGEILSHANEKEEKLVITEIDLIQTEKTRQIWPFLRDRRIDDYQNITKRFID